ncbi:MAG: hypothetical protein KDC12_03920 [Flavobacteriales bacterium]|nr:hypothetical protein [Flavobacteriales bacterium]
MNHRILIVVCLFSIPLMMAGQKKFDRSQEMGLMGGTAYYIGDINPRKHFGGNLKLAGGLFYRHNPSRRISIKGSFLYGRIEASDAQSKDPWQQNRNLSFRNDVFEGSLTVEINYFDYQIGTKEFISPYLFAGLGYYSMKPQASFRGVYYELQPLGTEGQGTSEGGAKYKTTGLSAPFGVGIKLNVYSIIAINLEWGMRKTWTDYFDDVSGTYVDPALLADENGYLSAVLSDQSLEPELPTGNNAGLQRGDPGRKDWYSFATIGIAFRLGKSPTNCWNNIDFSR